MAGRLNERLPGRTRITARRMAWLLVLAAVVLAHALATRGLAESIAGWTRTSPTPARLQVAFVRELKAAAPPVVQPSAQPPAPATLRAPRRVAPRPASAAASAPRQAAERRASQPVSPDAPALPGDAAPQAALGGDNVDRGPPPPQNAAPTMPPLMTDRVATAAPVLPGDTALAAVQAARERFAWPPSTRMSYALTGNYRGEVLGTAQVEWIHVGSRYQVHLDLTIGPSFAPIVSTRRSSEGETSAHGLAPTRYDEETRVAFRNPRLATILFEPDAIVLPGKPAREREPGVQDMSSQFVQLTWLFTTHPTLLVPGTLIEFPLALPRKVVPWTYEVIGAATLQTPIGPIETVHVKPRHPQRNNGSNTNDITAEMWIAPSLQYLPVRIRFDQDADTFIDLMIASAPLQAAAAMPPASAPYSSGEPRKDPP